MILKRVIGFILGGILFWGCLFDSPPQLPPPKILVTQNQTIFEYENNIIDSILQQQSQQFETRITPAGDTLTDTLIIWTKVQRIDSIKYQINQQRDVEINANTGDTISRKEWSDVKRERVGNTTGSREIDTIYQSRYSVISDSVFAKEDSTSKDTAFVEKTVGGTNYRDTVITIKNYFVWDSLIYKKIYYAELLNFSDSTDTLSNDLQNALVLDSIRKSAFKDSSTVVKRASVFPTFLQDSINVQLIYPRDTVMIPVSGIHSQTGLNGWNGEFSWSNDSTELILTSTDPQPSQSNLITFGSTTGNLTLTHSGGESDQLFINVQRNFTGFYPANSTAQNFWKVPSGPNSFLATPQRFALTTKGNPGADEPGPVAHVSSQFHFKGDFQFHLTAQLPPNTYEDFTVAIVLSPKQNLNFTQIPSDLVQLLGGREGFRFNDDSLCGIVFSENNIFKTNPQNDIFGQNFEGNFTRGQSSFLDFENEFRISRVDKTFIFEILDEQSDSYLEIERLTHFQEIPSNLKLHMFFGNYHPVAQSTLTFSDFSIHSGEVVFP